MFPPPVVFFFSFLNHQNLFVPESPPFVPLACSTFLVASCQMVSTVCIGIIKSSLLGPGIIKVFPPVFTTNPGSFAPTLHDVCSGKPTHAVRPFHSTPDGCGAARTPPLRKRKAMIPLITGSAAGQTTATSCGGIICGALLQDVLAIFDFEELWVVGLRMLRAEYQW